MPDNVTERVLLFEFAIGVFPFSHWKFGLPEYPDTDNAPLPQNVTGPAGLITGGGNKLLSIIELLKEEKLIKTKSTVVNKYKLDFFPELQSFIKEC